MYRIFLIASFLVCFNLAYGHGAVQRASELKDNDIRLFVADNMDGSVVTIDFPNGEIINRVSTPKSIMILASSRNKQYIYAMRGRDTDQDVVSIITTGYDSEKIDSGNPMLLGPLQLIPQEEPETIKWRRWVAMMQF